MKDYRQYNMYLFLFIFVLYYGSHRCKTAITPVSAPLHELMSVSKCCQHKIVLAKNEVTKTRTELTENGYGNSGFSELVEWKITRTEHRRDGFRFVHPRNFGQRRDRRGKKRSTPRDTCRDSRKCKFFFLPPAYFNFYVKSQIRSRRPK